MVPLGTPRFRLETESASWSEGLPQTVGRKAENAKRQETSLLAFRVNWRVALVRSLFVSSPRGTLFVTIL